MFCSNGHCNTLIFNVCLTVNQLQNLDSFTPLYLTSGDAFSECSPHVSHELYMLGGDSAVTCGPNIVLFLNK